MASVLPRGSCAGETDSDEYERDDLVQSTTQPASAHRGISSEPGLPISITLSRAIDTPNRSRPQFLVFQYRIEDVWPGGTPGCFEALHNCVGTPQSARDSRKHKWL